MAIHRDVLTASRLSTEPMVRFGRHHVYMQPVGTWSRGRFRPQSGEISEDYKSSGAISGPPVLPAMSDYITEPLRRTSHPGRRNAAAGNGVGTVPVRTAGRGAPPQPTITGSEQWAGIERVNRIVA